MTAVAEGIFPVGICLVIMPDMPFNLTDPPENPMLQVKESAFYPLPQVILAEGLESWVSNLPIFFVDCNLHD